MDVPPRSRAYFLCQNEGILRYLCAGRILQYPLILCILIRKMKEIVYTQKQLPEIADRLIELAPTKILCFYGEMGSGKTTLIKALVKTLGAGEIANSPTFGIVNEYHKATGELLGYHFDFYRLNSEAEALDLGLEDYLQSDIWTFMEWPEKIASLLPEDTVDIYLEVVDDQTRKLRI